MKTAPHMLNCPLQANKCSADAIELDPDVIYTYLTDHTVSNDRVSNIGYCRAIKTEGMVFRYTWVYSKEDIMAHTYRPVVTS